MKYKFLLPLAAVLFIMSCNTEEIGNSRDVNPATIFTSYRITYSESEPTVNCFAQFRFAGERGTTLLLNDSSQVLLDGWKISSDSSEYGGVFYETEKQMPAFSGMHTWCFRDIKGKEYKETFNFTPVSLAEELPPFFKPEARELHFKGTMDGDSLIVYVSDTSKTTPETEAYYLISKDKISLNASLFANQKAGPIKIQISIVRRNRLKHCPEEGGFLIQQFIFKERNGIMQPAGIVS